MITEFKSGKPVIPETAFIAHSADIIGNVEIGEFASVWFNAVIRGDMAGIRIGERTNIQDNTVIHTDPPLTVHIGNDVPWATARPARLQDRQQCAYRDECHGFRRRGNRG